MRIIDYPRARNIIKDGQVFWTRPTSLFGKGIGFFDNTNKTHCGIFIWEGERLMCVEAIKGKGVIRRPASEMINECKRFWFGDLNHGVGRDKIHDRVLSKGKGLPELGTRYDFFGAIVAKLFDTKSKQVYCSEYVSKIFGLDKTNYTPKGLFNLSIVRHEVYETMPKTKTGVMSRSIRRIKNLIFKR